MQSTEDEEAPNLVTLPEVMESLVRIAICRQENAQQPAKSHPNALIDLIETTRNLKVAQDEYRVKAKEWEAEEAEQVRQRKRDAKAQKEAAREVKRKSKLTRSSTLNSETLVLDELMAGEIS